MAVAPLVAGYHRLVAKSLPSPSRGVSRSGVPFLQHQFGDNARLTVEVAWGSNVADDPDTWTWTDITTDVRLDPGISITIGRSDEASTAQPANCTMILDNRSGDYSVGGQSKNWPNVKRNVPVRVRTDLGSGSYTRFYGYATSFAPEWDVTGENATVNFVASGILRRLIQGDAPTKSALRRNSETDPTMVAYWPCEDLKNSKRIASGIEGGVPMLVDGTALPTFEASTAFDASDAILSINSGHLYGSVAPYEDTGEAQVRWLAVWPDSGIATGTTLVRVSTTGTASRWEIVYDTGSGGILTLKVYDRDGATLVTDGPWAFAVDGRALRMFIVAEESGGDIDYFWGAREAPAPSVSQFVTDTLAGETIGTVTGVQFGHNADLKSLAVGHVTVQDQVTSQFDDAFTLGAYEYDFSFTITTGGIVSGSTLGRLGRLCDEHGIPLTRVTQLGGTYTSLTSYALRMGPQIVDSIVNLLREAETTAQGILFDGLAPGVIAVMSYARENLQPALTIDAASGDLVMPFFPADDDQGNVNRATVTAKQASEYVYEDVDGPLGTNAIGIYDEAQTVSLTFSSDAAHHAGWLVHQGTIEGYRYPNLSLNLAKTPRLLQLGNDGVFPGEDVYPSSTLYPLPLPAPTGWLDVLPGNRVDIVNLDAARTQVPEGRTSVLVQGWTETISQFRWDVSVNCSPYDPWQIFGLSEDTLDSSEFTGHLDTDESTLAVSAATGATSLSVAVSSGPLWTTNSDDLPFNISLAGRMVTVTAISGASSPQTFTVEPIPATAPAGVPIALWKPRALGL